MENQCPCGSGEQYETCCLKFINGSEKPGTAEQLMRSRYSAYTKQEIDYIEKTTHPNSLKQFDRESTAQWAKDSQWMGLEIISVKDGKENDDVGEIEFKAKYIEKKVTRSHHEFSVFKKHNDMWYFHTGDKAPQKPIVNAETKIGRNDPCPCGSGKKYKKCCAKK